MKLRCSSRYRPPHLSPPARGRGLKRHNLELRYLPPLSPPARGRGLKHGFARPYCAMYLSPPARGRGLKLWHDVQHVSFLGRPPRGGVD